MNSFAIVMSVALCLLVTTLTAHTAPVPNFRSAADALHTPQSRFFWIQHTTDRYTFGDPVSLFDLSYDASDLTFDISNNKALANLSPNGTLKTLTIYRDSYRGCCQLPGWPGVWTGKDSSSYGAYSYSLTVDGIYYDLAKVGWDCRTGLLDNIFPTTEMHPPDKRFTVRLLTFAPLSADGGRRLRGVIYGLLLENSSQAPLKGSVHLPKLFTTPRQNTNWAVFDPYDFEIGLADAPRFSKSVAFDLKPGESVWVPTILYQPGEPTVAEVNARGSLAWLRDTWSYYRNLLGRLQTPTDPWLAEFYERQLLQAFEALAMSGSGTFAGSNWGSYPATRQIWGKDLFYSCLPLLPHEPALAQKMILWFDTYGVRHPGEVVEGGINHSISLTVGSLLLASLYYDQTGDRAFFTAHRSLQTTWAHLLDGLIASRQEPDVWLFPTRFISDGRLDCDWHCGSNLAVWRALKGYARLCAEVYADASAAKKYAAAADRVRDAILKKTVIRGPFGPQFIEGVNRDGKVPRMTSDGEESETTLMPFYGFLSYDDPTYLNYMRFSMSLQNAQYVQETHSIDWGKGVPATAPGFNKGLCAGIDADSLFGEHGYYTEIRRVTERDGSVWWWPYARTSDNKIHIRRFPGKSGWFAGVHSALFVDRFLGIGYEAPTQTLRCAPLPATGDFSWEQMPFGSARFGVICEYDKDRHDLARLMLTNHNGHTVHLVAELPIASSRSVTVNGKPLANLIRGRHLNHETLRLTVDIPAGQRVEVR